MLIVYTPVLTDDQTSGDLLAGRPGIDGNVYGFFHNGALLKEVHQGNPTVDTLLDKPRIMAGISAQRLVN